MTGLLIPDWMVSVNLVVYYRVKPDEAACLAVPTMGC